LKAFIKKILIRLKQNEDQILDIHPGSGLIKAGHLGTMS
jgi:hypothetical protein